MPLLTTLQSTLESLHDVTLGIDVTQFVVDEEGRRDLPGARAELERALTIVEAALGPDHPTVAVLRGDLQRVLNE